MLTSVDARRRWFGTFFLILAGGLLLWGLTFLNPFLLKKPMLFVGYWVTCFLLTFLSFSIAIYDLFVMRRRIRDEQKTVFERAFKGVEDPSDLGSENLGK